VDFRPNWYNSLQDLLERPLQPEEMAMKDWLTEWDAVERSYTEHWISLYRDRHLDTSNETARAALKAFEGEVLPRLNTLSAKLKTRFLNLVANTELDNLLSFQHRFATDARAFAHIEADDYGRIQDLVNDIEARNDAAKPEVGGRVLTPTEVRDIALRGTRIEREEAWRAVTVQRLAHVDATKRDAQQVFAAWQSIAEHSGASTLRQYRWCEPGDFNPEGARDLQTVVLEGVTPLMQTLTAARGKALDLETVRPWDLDVGLPEVRVADNHLTGREVVTRLIAGLDQLTPELSVAIRSLPETALELDRHPNKSNQGFMAFLPESRHPYVFATYRGNTLSLATLIHEIGHAVHAASAASKTPWVFDLESGERSSFSETVAFLFELFTLEALSTSACGLVAPEALVAVRREKAARIIDRLYIVAYLELIEHFVYEDDARNRTASQLEEYVSMLDARYPDGVDRSGLETLRRPGWIQSRSLREPFTVGLYGRALIGALAHYRVFLQDPGAAVHKLLKVMQLPRSQPDHVLYTALGVRYPFTHADVRAALDVLADLMR
jgi:oligoendopeptidase F